MAPAIAFAQELERLPQQVGRGQRQVFVTDVGNLRYQRRGEGQAAIGLAHRQLDHVRGMRVLAVDQLHRWPVLAQRQAQAHVQLQRRHPRLVRGEGGAHGGTGHHQVGFARGVAQHRGTGAEGDMAGLDPGRVALAGDEQPLPVAALVQHRHRIAGEQGRFLEAVDVGVTGRAEHPQPGREGAQVGAMHHQAVAQRPRGRDRIQRDRVLHRDKIFGRDRSAVFAVQGAGGGHRQGLDLAAHEVGRQRVGQGGDVDDRPVLAAHARVLRGDGAGIQDQPVRFGQPGDPVRGGELGLGDADHPGGRRRHRRTRGQAGRQQRSQQQDGR